MTPPPPPAPTAPPDEDMHAILSAALKTLVTYCKWQMKEGGSHHPTLPSAIVGAEEALARAEQLNAARQPA